MKKIKVVAAIIENPKGEILCPLRPENKILGNMWEFPGGKIEENENQEEALKREILEELEIEIENIRYFSTAIKEYEDFEVELSCYMCKISGRAKIKLNEHRAGVWLKRKNLKSIVWVPTDLPIIDKLMEKKI